MAGSGKENRAASLNETRAFAAARDITDMTGAVTEFQRKNLERWPLVAIPGSVVEGTKTTIEVGEPRSKPDDNGDMHRTPRFVRVVYDVQAKGRSSARAKALGAEALTVWTKYLFWPNTEVKVLVNGREISPKAAADGKRKGRAV